MSDEGENIFALVAQLARRATDGQLVIAAAVGIASAALIGLAWPGWWLLALPLLCIGSFGIWGIAERRPLSDVRDWATRFRAGAHSASFAWRQPRSARSQGCSRCWPSSRARWAPGSPDFGIGVRLEFHHSNAGLGVWTQSRAFE